MKKLNVQIQSLHNKYYYLKNRVNNLNKRVTSSTHPMDLDAVVAHQVLVTDALEYLEFLSDVADCAVVIGLKRQLLHCHQLSRLVVYGCVHLAEPSLTWTQIVV